MCSRDSHAERNHAARSNMPEVFAELEKVQGRLERHFRDMQDFEFTIEDGRLPHAPNPQR